MVDQTILHYQIVRKLGEGGMGVVYLARDNRLKRQVAIKFLPPQIAANTEQRQRFEIEAQAAAALNHPNIATIYAIEETEQHVFIVMEYIEGRELREIIKVHESSNLLLETILTVSIQIARGLKAAHDKDIIHRDIKPANIMVTDDEQVKIMDFGLAKMSEASLLTQVGITLGTINYMSPEQSRGDAFDKRTDIWSFGVMLYEMLTGKLPFRGHYEQAVIYSIMNEEPESLASQRPDIQPYLQPVVSKMLAKNPEERYASITELLNDLEQPRQRRSNAPSLPRKEEIPVETEQTDIPAAEPVKENQPAASRKPIMAMTVSLLLAAMAAVAYFSFQEESGPPQLAALTPGDSSSANAVQNLQAEQQREPASNALGESRDVTEPVSADHSVIITELSKLTDTSSFLEKLNDYKNAMQLAVGKRSDFASIDNCYVFVADDAGVKDVFQYAANRFTSLKSGAELNDLSVKYAGKTTIWVRDLSRR